MKPHVVHKAVYGGEKPEAYCGTRIWHAELKISDRLKEVTCKRCLAQEPPKGK